MKYILLIIVCASSLLAQQRIYPPLSGDKITDIHFLNETEMIFVNEGGGIYKSYDGGISWKEKEVFQSESFRKVKFLDEEYGFVLPEFQTQHGGTGLKVTDDGGESWRTEKLNFNHTKDFLPISKNAIIKSDWSGNILRLDNFFNQWDTTYQMPTFTIDTGEFGEITYPYGYVEQFELLPSGGILSLNVNIKAYDAEIINDSLNMILKSIDGGISWDTVWTGFSLLAREIDFISDSIGYLRTDEDTLFYTENGGADWSSKNLPDSISYANDISAVSKDSIFFSSMGRVYLSDNGGETWRQFDLDLEMFDRIEFYNSQLGFVIGKNLIRTDNGGTDWKNVHDHFIDDIVEIDFVNTEVGFANGMRGFYKTYDGGETWEELNTLPLLNDKYPMPPYNIAMIDENYGFVNHESGKLLKTTDGGASWIDIELQNNPDDFYNLEFFNKQFGMINGAFRKKEDNSGEFDYFHYITNDAGNNWQLIQATDTSDAIRFDKIDFVEPDLLYGINRSGLWLSKDSSKSWTKIYDPGGTGNFHGTYSFDFFDKQFGILKTSYRESKYTTDGAITWETHEGHESIYVNDFKILGKDIWNRYVAFEIGRKGRFYKYTYGQNGEFLYERQIETGTNLVLSDIEIFDNNGNIHSWVSGYGFNLYHRDHQQEITSIGREPNKLPGKFSLSQNFPNPFNPLTKIKFAVPKHSHVKLEIFNTLGQKIETLVDEVKSPGNHEVSFDGSELSSGVYIYRLISDEFTKSGKMLLMK